MYHLNQCEDLIKNCLHIKALWRHLVVNSSPLIDTFLARTNDHFLNTGFGGGGVGWNSFLLIHKVKHHLYGATVASIKYKK